MNCQTFSQSLCKWGRSHHIPCRKFRLPYFSEATTAAGVALRIPNSMCSISMSPNSDMALSSPGDFLRAHRCWCMWGLHKHCKRVCPESWLGEKSLATRGNRTCLSGVPVQCSTSWATSSWSKERSGRWSGLPVHENMKGRLEKIGTKGRMVFPLGFFIYSRYFRKQIVFTQRWWQTLLADFKFCDDRFPRQRPWNC